MSIILGLLKESGALVTTQELQSFSAPTERYGTGASSSYSHARLGMSLQLYESHERSTMDDRPFTDARGNAVSFDGRLDNYRELARMLDLDYACASDSHIVVTAFLRWGEGCFSRLTGDWAMALWSEKEQALFLARDHAGTRTLYFCQDERRTMWSTCLDTFQMANSDLAISQDYVARYLACLPIRDLTPWEGIRSVPPAHYLVFRDAAVCQRSHWDSLVTNTIRYKDDSQYEQHFLELFKQSVDRRTGPGAPILAQLSGGMDSTSIVCMSDYLRRASNLDVPILDTVSFYDDSERSLDEKAYFSITEAKREKVGTHLDMAFSSRTFEPHDVGTHGAYLVPGADSLSICRERLFNDLVWHKGYRSILSGIGGDEILGGIPIALPELAGYLVTGKIRMLLRQSFAWSLIDRKPLATTLYDTIKYTLRLYGLSGSGNLRIPPWISTSLKIRAQEIETENETSQSTITILPHCLDNAIAWRSVLETLPHLVPQILTRPEFRYPFLDKDLVNYLFAIPREQVLRPGRRRSLMRRALRSIVPFEILERPRKAFQLSAPLRAIQAAQPKLEELFAESLTACANFIDIESLRLELRRAAQGESEWWQALLKTIAFELWLRAGPPRNGWNLRRAGAQHINI
jgi:asparagine synthase (glutamine-hydrolysing)